MPIERPGCSIISSRATLQLFLLHVQFGLTRRSSQGRFFGIFRPGSCRFFLPTENKNVFQTVTQQKSAGQYTSFSYEVARGMGITHFQIYRQAYSIYCKWRCNSYTTKNTMGMHLSLQNGSTPVSESPIYGGSPWIVRAVYNPSYKGGK